MAESPDQDHHNIQPVDAEFHAQLKQAIAAIVNAATAMAIAVVVFEPPRGTTGAAAMRRPPSPN